MSERVDLFHVEPAGSDTGAPRNREKRLDLIERHAIPLRGKKVLDCGCGAGAFLSSFYARGADAWGLEYQRDKLAQLQDAHPEIADRAMVGDIEQLCFGADTFDLILLNEVIEHVPDDQRALHEIHRVLKPNGFVILFAPNRLYPFETHGVYRKSDGKFVPIHTPFIPYLPIKLGSRWFNYWARNYWPSEMRAMVENCHYEITHHGSAWQTFENISGVQPPLVKLVRPFLTKLFPLLEKVPFINRFGVSQFVVAQKK